MSDTMCYTHAMKMPSPRIDALDWDEWNLAHITKHQVTQGEVEDVVTGDALVYTTYKHRFIVTGPTIEGRMLTVIIGESPRQHHLYYVFSARPASRTERHAYLTEKGGDTL